ncbi:hypothetical protein Q7P37_003751 [Cladosporium fusiforme]
MKTTNLATIALGAVSFANNGDASPQDLAFRMLSSIEARGQATIDSGASTGFIQLGLFWQALAVVTEPAPISAENDALRPLLTTSLTSTLPSLSNVTRNSELPLDRFSLGASMLAWELQTRNSSFGPTIQALNDSLALQPRNTNGALWYYDNINNLTAYRNLSYLDGMYSLAPYAVLQSLRDGASSEPLAALDFAVEQIRLLHEICARPSGLLVHGFDALKAHQWADASSGASPEVWGGSLAWFTLGLLNTLEVAKRVPGLEEAQAYCDLRLLFQETVQAQVKAAEHSKALTNKAGVWQVVDRPGEAGNFIEASSSFMTVYSFLRGQRMGFLHDRNRSLAIAAEMYAEVSQLYLVTYANGSLSLNGTSSVASLSPQNVGYDYYVSRPREFDSLLGTSAFALASYEMGKL